MCNPTLNKSHYTIFSIAPIPDSEFNTQLCLAEDFFLFRVRQKILSKFLINVHAIELKTVRRVGRAHLRYENEPVCNGKSK